MKVAELFATFDIRPNLGSIAAMNRQFRIMRGAAMGVAAFFAGGALFRGLIGFNKRVEDAKLNVAAMLALAKDTSVTDQLTTANKLYDDIRKKAAELPGTTEEYVQAMSLLTLPLTRAGFDLEKLKELTVNTVVAAKGIGITTVAASVRDVQQFLSGRFTSTDLFLKQLFGAEAESEEGRKKLKSGTVKDRAKRLEQALLKPQIAEAAKLQAQTFSGQMDKMKEAVAQFLGRVGLPLFKALTDLLQRVNKWLAANHEAVERVADAIGGGLMFAFGLVGDAIGLLVEHGDAARAMLQGLAFVLAIIVGNWLKNWVMFAAPWLRIFAIVSGLLYIFNKLRGAIGDVGAVLVTGFLGLAVLRFRGFVAMIWASVRAMLGLAAATGVAAGAQSTLMTRAAGAAAVSRWSQLAGGLMVPGAQGAAQFANGQPGAKGGGKVGAGAGLLAVASRVSLPLTAAGMINDLTGGSFGDDHPFMRHLRGESVDLGAYSRKALGGSGGDDAAIKQSINAPVTININGVKGAEDAIRELQVEQEKSMRQWQKAFAGGLR